MSDQVWWYVARSGGIVAWALVTLAVCWGLFVSTKATAKAAAPASVLDLHRFLGGLAMAFTAVHVAGLVADSHVHFGWAEMMVPWASEWKPTAVAWGVIAMYLLVAVEVTSLMVKRLPRRLWRRIHRSSYALYVLSTVHGIQAGTDANNPWLRMAMIASVNIVGFLTALAILAARRKALGGTDNDRIPRAAHPAREAAEAAATN